MDSPSRSSVIIVGAGISGIMAAKILAENGVKDLLILEASDRIGGRIRMEKFSGQSVEIGAGWIAGVGGIVANPILELANKYGLRHYFTDNKNLLYNIHDRCGKIFPIGLVTESFKKAVDSEMHKMLRYQKGKCNTDGELSKETEPPSTPSTPLELAIDFLLHDFELAEVKPVPTFVEFGRKESFVADERGYDYLLYKLAQDFLFSSDAKISDSRLKLNKVVREVLQSRNGVTVVTEDGSCYETEYVVLSVSIGVLQSNLISFTPPLPRWKMEAIEKCDVLIYTKIFLKFPYKFWPSGPQNEFFVYAHQRRGYYTLWQQMEKAYPGSNMLVVTLINEESKRVEAQSDIETLKEAMQVLKDMFGPNIPDATDILVPRWWTNRFQCCSYTNYPDRQLIRSMKAPYGRIFFTGEHTNEKYSGFVHGGYLAGIDTAKALLQEMGKDQTFQLQSLVALNTDSLTLSQTGQEISGVNNKRGIPRPICLSNNLGSPRKARL